MATGVTAVICRTSMPSKAVAADVGLSTLGRCSTSRGRAAQQMSEGRPAAPAVLLSTIT